MLNSAFKKIDLVPYPAWAEGFGKYDKTVFVYTQLNDKTVLS